MTVLDAFQPAVRKWFQGAFDGPTPAQTLGWPPIARGDNTLLLAPTGSGKTLAAFLAALDRLMFAPPPDGAGVRVLYVSPLKALGVDVERNLRSPIAGIRSIADADGLAYREPAVGIRSGDTPSAERARMLRRPPDILITTPESLYLLATSRARDTLKRVETVIVDEIHSLVGTKRGAHLFVSLERLQAAADHPIQRIGLSATQRPLDEVARALGGGQVEDSRWRARPVEIVDAGRKRAFELTIEVPVEDMTDLSSAPPSGPAAAQTDSGSLSRPPSIWPSIHPRLVELIRAHRSTMAFVNSRRLAERLAAAINEEAGEELALAHHGSLAKEARAAIEDRLKRGQLPAIVATSSLELGVDMGAVDLVIQVEAPPSVASGMQRVGRAGHRADAVSKAVVFPKYRGDLVACAAVAEQMREGTVEATFYPRNPLDVLAQQITAIVAEGPRPVDDVYDLVRRAAPFSDLPRSSFESVLDMLCGRYPSEELSDLRPLLTWDRIADQLSPRHRAQRVAIINGGTIPDRGLYGVFLADDSGARSRRVGELDEEMVFESRAGDVVILGASSWRIEDITPDRVIVTPAPGEPGKMPFWHGDRPGRPAELGRVIGGLTRELAAAQPADARQRLAEAGLDAKAATNLLAYLAEQQEATGTLPSDRAIVVERFTDEIGDWRVCVLSPFGARVHAPWATAVAGRLRSELDVEVDVIWSDDGIVFRLPEADEPPAIVTFIPEADEVESLIVKEVGQTSLFASRFRENAARALLLPKKTPGRRTPLWALRRRSASLLQAAAKYDSFPIIMETYRECLKDVFDLPALQTVLRDVASRKIRTLAVDSRTPSPFASALLFGFVANFIYDGDAPLAERRAQVLSIDHAQLRELLGEAELRELIDPEAIADLETQLQRRGEGYELRHADHLHDRLLELGDLSLDEIASRTADGVSAGELTDELAAARRAVAIVVAGETRWVAVEHAAAYRDALGAVLPGGLPSVFVEATESPLEVLVARYARTHGPFVGTRVAERFAISTSRAEEALGALEQSDRVLRGAFLPGGTDTEWCAPDVLRSLKRMSLARLRKQVEPVPEERLGAFLPAWHRVGDGARGLDALLDIVEQLQGASLPASALEAEILPARLDGYSPRDLDELCAAGEVVWRGLEARGGGDGRIALFLADHYPRLGPPPTPTEGELAARIRELLEDKGAVFFADLLAGTGAFPRDLVEALWDLVWSGEVTNDTLAPLRSLVAPAAARRGSRVRTRSGFRSRRLGPPGTEGRWTLLMSPVASGRSDTEFRAARTRQLLQRHGVLTREAVHAEGVEGGFSSVYPVLKAMEAAGQVRRGYFVAGLGAAQFALPGAEDRLRDASTAEGAVVLAATDPANPYGAALRWPDHSTNQPQRVPGASVILLDGELRAFVGRTDRTVLTFLPPEEPERGRIKRRLAETLAQLATRGGRRAILLSKIDGRSPAESELAGDLEEAGFGVSSRGFLKRRTS